MKQFIAFIKKEFYHILRDKRTMLILIGMPVVQIILFGFAISTEVRNVQTAVLINSANTDIQRIVDQLDASEYFNVKYVVHSPTEIEDLFAKNKIELAVAFADDLNRQRFDSEQIQIIADATDPNLAVTRGAYANGVLSKALAAIGQSLSAGKIIVSSKLLYNPQMKSAYNFVPGVMGLILMLICTMMTAVSIVREKETGTMELLLVSPVKPLWVILSKLMPYLVLSAVNFTTILLLAHYVMEVPINGSLLLLSFAALVFVLTSLSLGILVSVISSSQRTAMLLCGMGLTMPTMIFSGIIFPCESMPQILQWFSDIIPAKWFIILVKKIMIQGDGLSAAIKELSILAGMAVLLLAVSIRSFRTRLQ